MNSNVQQGAKRHKAVRAEETSILTPKLIERAKRIAADKQSSIDMLKRAGILDEHGRLAKEYAN